VRQKTPPRSRTSGSSADGYASLKLSETTGSAPGQLPERVVIEGVRPEVEGGRFPARAVVGQRFVVEADVFAEYEPVVSGVLLHRREGDEKWNEAPMLVVGEDRQRSEFLVEELGSYSYTLEAWIDHFATWRRALVRKVEAKLDVSVELKVGSVLVREAAARASGGDAKRLSDAASRLAAEVRPRERVRIALGDDLAALMGRHPDRSRATRHRELTLTVDTPKAVFSSWYELFPRSWAAEPGQHGTFRDVERMLPYVKDMGFDVLYLPPIHPIGRTHRKGKNNALTAGPDDPGSPWAIGSEEGGHKSVHPALGTLDDFRHLVERARESGIDIALDIAFQCSPDHPYVKEHPEWFKRRPDGGIQYAENPPKKYEDIYPFDFESEDWQALWEELMSVFTFWANHGAHVFRVDNPHTKPFRFWEWAIAEVKREFPDAIFLSEAFTRPRLMEQLTKAGFTQSYTYFAWKTTKQQIADYFTLLNTPPLKDYFRPNAWPNTPDILTEYLVSGGRRAFIVRLVLAATLSASYGIYGPAFELGEHIPAQPGSEDYLNSEKYELKRWDIERKDSLRGIITQVNAIRRENPALQANDNLRFHTVDDEKVIAYSKRTEDAGNVVLVVVNLDPRRSRSGIVELPVEEWGLDPRRSYPVRDLLNATTTRWRGPRQRIELRESPAAIFQLRGNGGGRKGSPA
jgi:starch synthase (maltosyl-transferring)